ncbi:MAG: DUF6350 family protein [Rhodoluna sp.]
MRIKAAIQGVVQTSLVVAVGYVGIFLINFISWLVEQTTGSSFTTVLQTTSRIWLNANFVPIEFAAGRIANVTVPAYQFTLVPLGFAFLLLWLQYRVGKKIAEQEYLGFSWAGAIATYALVAFGATATSASKLIRVQDWQGVFIPVALFSAVVIASSVFAPAEFEGQLRSRLRNFTQRQIDRLPWSIRPLISPALRAGTAVVATMAAFSAIAVSVLIALNWVEAIKLYQGLQLSFLGTLVISLGQLALMPNLIIYGMSWLTGVGFSVGAGSAVSPLAVELGPLPAIPLLTVLPAKIDSMAIAFVLIPLLAAFFATLLVKPFTTELRFNYASATSEALALGIGVGLVAATEMLILADLASGSIGPARMSEVGISLWQIFLVTFIEVGVVSAVAAFFSARPDAVDTELVQKVRRLK